MWWSDEAYQVFECPTDPFRVLGFQLIQLHEPGKYVDEYENVLESPSCSWEFQEITHDPFPNVGCFQGYAWNTILRYRFSILITDAAVGDKLLHILVDGGPDCITLDFGYHFLHTGVTCEVVPVEILHDLLAHVVRDYCLKDLAVCCLAIRLLV